MTALKDKTIIITGASRGIGEAAARNFADQGAAVVLAARSGDAIDTIAAEIREAGGTASALACDVADFSAVQQLVDHAVATHGRLDGLINNAAVIDPIAHIAEADPAAWGKAVDINVKGVFHGLRAALPPMLDQGGGTIVNISSGAATGVLEGWSAYCSTKAAVLSLTRATHLEYGDRGIRVMGLSPGTVATQMQREIKASGLNPVSQLDWEDHIPPEWVAQGLAFLFEPAANDWLGTDFSLKTPEGRAAAGLPAA
ncbi:SDR family oxidoreductase [Marinibacterium profundimaris]|uniref:Short-chain dehydrogenase n=1 Tax=Marinibacterium profundimaris TaxID=1679460 RepID=A0A225NRV9_9RHOB|nr:SDR family oxidoreductase [Marinibacterium profundimaris]OWU77661.1 short-chain dehydrogenase [Marinibacterium profundimaris]